MLRELGQTTGGNTMRRMLQGRASSVQPEGQGRYAEAPEEVVTDEDEERQLDPRMLQ